MRNGLRLQIISSLSSSQETYLIEKANLPLRKQREHNGWKSPRWARPQGSAGYSERGETLVEGRASFRLPCHMSSPPSLFSSSHNFLSPLQKKKNQSCFDSFHFFSSMSSRTTIQRAHLKLKKFWGQCCSTVAQHPIWTAGSSPHCSASDTASC